MDVLNIARLLDVFYKSRPAVPDDRGLYEVCHSGFEFSDI